MPVACACLSLARTSSRASSRNFPRSIPMREPHLRGGVPFARRVEPGDGVEVIPSAAGGAQATLDRKPLRRGADPDLARRGHKELDVPGRLCARVRRGLSAGRSGTVRAFLL